MTDPKKKVIFCVPTLTKPTKPTLESLKASIPLIVEAGWEEGMVSEIAARPVLLRVRRGQVGRGQTRRLPRPNRRARPAAAE